MTHLNELLIFLWKETHSETKIMEIVKDFDEKSYNNNGKPWKSSRILRLKTKTFIFLHFLLFLNFPHFSTFLYIFHVFIFSFFFMFLHVCSFSRFFFIFPFCCIIFFIIFHHFSSFFFIVFRVSSFFIIFLHFSLLFFAFHHFSSFTLFFIIFHFLHFSSCFFIFFKKNCSLFFTFLYFSKKNLNVSLSFLSFIFSCFLFFHFSNCFFLFFQFLFFHLLFLLFFLSQSSKETPNAAKNRPEIPIVKFRFLGLVGQGSGVAHLRVTSLSSFFFFHFSLLLEKMFLPFLFSCISFKCLPLAAFALVFNQRCFLRCRCSMEMWCPDDRGQESWDWVGSPTWGRV